VHLLVRGKRMRASAAMQDRVLAHEKVAVHYSTAVRDAYGDAKGLKGLLLYDTGTGARAPARMQCSPMRSLVAQRRVRGTRAHAVHMHALTCATKTGAHSHACSARACAHSCHRGRRSTRAHALLMHALFLYLLLFARAVERVGDGYL
jgi:hypothetical protein